VRSGTNTTDAANRAHARNGDGSHGAAQATAEEHEEVERQKKDKRKTKERQKKDKRKTKERQKKDKRKTKERQKKDKEKHICYVPTA
jgi:hypothetical protein